MATLSDNHSANHVAVGDDDDDDDAHSSGKADSTSKCQCCHVCCAKVYSHCFKPCMTKYNPLPETPSRCQRLRYAFLCPPHGPLNRVVTLALCLLLVWGVMWAISGEQALLGGNFFALIVLFVLCVLGGELMKLMHLPPLLGKPESFL